MSKIEVIEPESEQSFDYIVSNFQGTAASLFNDIGAHAPMAFVFKRMSIKAVIMVNPDGNITPQRWVEGIRSIAEDFSAVMAIAVVHVRVSTVKAEELADAMGLSPEERLKNGAEEHLLFYAETSAGLRVWRARGLRLEKGAKLGPWVEIDNVVFPSGDTLASGMLPRRS